MAEGDLTISFQALSASHALGLTRPVNFRRVG
ncbi:hypothetical protein Pla52o_43330 [Novipirellula galeiformis]|uniref:Uncharacterized protein n=1 Tax=Novipirellula galeiformis TaxID=2528004 RepID=A0A5C6C8P6_9BACT|nr:hypothetical protein Pla52o_43330 [Novipirellula galeiformis]